MIAINSIGQMLIANAQMTRAVNKLETLRLLTATSSNVQEKKIEEAKDNIEKAYSLVNDSCSLAFLAFNGLDPLVANEQIDGHNHNILSRASEEIYIIFKDLFKIILISYVIKWFVFIHIGFEKGCLLLLT